MTADMHHTSFTVSNMERSVALFRKAQVNCPRLV